MSKSKKISEKEGEKKVEETDAMITINVQEVLFKIHMYTY